MAARCTPLFEVISPSPPTSAPVVAVHDDRSRAAAVESDIGQPQSMAHLAVVVVSSRLADQFAGLAADRACASAYATWSAACSFGGVSGTVTAAATGVPVGDSGEAAGIDVVLEVPLEMVATEGVAAEAGKEQKVQVLGRGRRKGEGQRVQRLALETVPSRVMLLDFLSLICRVERLQVRQWR